MLAPYWLRLERYPKVNKPHKNHSNLQTVDKKQKNEEPSIHFYECGDGSYMRQYAAISTCNDLYGLISG